MTIQKQDLKRYFQVFIIILGAGSIYPLVYLRQNFEVPILETFKVDKSQLLEYYSMIGIMFFVGYVPSGWLADRFSPKYLLTFSLAVTGILGLVFAQIPPPEYLGFIFLSWGVSTVLTFWGAHLKCVKMLAKTTEQGRFFGALDGGKGLVEAFLATIALAIFAYTIGGTGDDASLEDTRVALVRVIYMYAVTCILLSIIILIFLDSETKQIEAEGETRQLHKSNMIGNLMELLKIPEIWFVAIILSCGYQVFWATYSFSGYLQTSFSTGTVIAGFITVTKLWMRPIGGFSAGWLGDRFNNSLVLALTLFVAAASFFILAFASNLGSFWALIFMLLFIGLLTYAIRGLYWAILDICNLPLCVTGLAIGFISLVGYSADILIPQINKYFFDQYGDQLGYQYYYGYTAIIGFIGGFFALYLYYRLKAREI